MKAVVLQPMYLPWMGYFGMIDQADVFVFYDDVQFNRDSWQQRNRVKVPEASGETEWLKVPIIRDFGQDIQSVQIDTDRDWQDDHFSTIESVYGSDPVPYGHGTAAHYEDYIELFRRVFEKEWTFLCDLNTHIIQDIYSTLELSDIEFYYSSEFEIEGSGTDKLINTLQHIGADEYISGPGAKDYLDIDSFREEGISLYWHEFDHPEYDQLYGEFVSHLSIIDALFNVGENTRSLIRKGEANALVQETG